MRFPEFLFRLARAPEATGPLIELFAFRVVRASTSTGFGVNIPGPAKDRVIVVTNVSCEVNPGATQAITRIVISGQTPGGLVFQIAQVGFTAVADFRTGFDWQGEVAIGGAGVDGNVIIVDSVWDAGVNANSLIASVFGYVIPRGNIAPF